MLIDNYFVWKTPCNSEPYRVVRREVKARTSKGYPITYVLKYLPVGFESWAKAQSVADQLNRGHEPEELKEWLEEETEQEIE